MAVGRGGNWTSGVWSLMASIKDVDDGNGRKSKANLGEVQAGRVAGESCLEIERFNWLQRWLSGACLEQRNQSHFQTKAGFGFPIETCLRDRRQLYWFS